MSSLISDNPASWIRALPQRAQPYVLLARLDKPAGFMLLLYPAWWALALCAPKGGWPDLGYFILFYLGAVIMRAAGCAINDVFDHKLDAQVERTKLRPIACGQIKPWQGIVFAACCSLIGLGIVMQMDVMAVWLAVASLPLIVLYPLMKRITWWPQIFLGIIFNWGALMGFAAVTGGVPLPAWMLYAGCFFWTLAYDTVYAFQDIRDDEGAGIKSSARRLGRFARPAIMLWAVICWGLLLVAGFMTQMSLVFYIGMAGAALYMMVTLLRWHPHDATSSFAAFHANMVFGDIVLGSMIIGRVMA